MDCQVASCLGKDLKIFLRIIQYYFKNSAIESMVSSIVRVLKKVKECEERSCDLFRGTVCKKFSQAGRQEVGEADCDTSVYGVTYIGFIGARIKLKKKGNQGVTTVTKSLLYLLNKSLPFQQIFLQG
ncbi:hypothetical protein POM88_023448 [Heracleum sosnowskyi]|uniref:Uncharacterized protein n=1 Tax=Heracleum sosnowskyi TaxID=360622 RepID=A0AAD8MVX4_9APIA|nr:hypothetical protein POM88_023448 [Heracleum sosnowskyi]